MCFPIAIIVYCVGAQIRFTDLTLLFNKVNYVKQLPQYVIYCCFVVFVFCILCDIVTDGVASLLLFASVGLFLSFVTEFLLSKLNPNSKFISFVIRLVELSLLCLIISSFDASIITPFAVCGLYLTNTPFGVVHGKDYRISSYLSRTKNSTYEKLDSVTPDISFLPKFRAGSKHDGTSPRKKYNVEDYGIKPNVKYDQIDKINELIEHVGKNGGGRVIFPAGKYFLNQDSTRIQFIQINHSNVVLEGTLSAKGELQTELINCSSTVYGARNPWLSPFFITTGENIQQSNWFWGLQFRKKQNVFTKSVSASDPGSDGSILTPECATKLTADSLQGTDILYVEDSSKLSKYVLLGLYNTDESGNLIKDILSIDIKEEWKTPLRAGVEEAPSFQWLIEIKEIIDNKTIRITQPLWRDCLMEYEPALYNVEMLENVVVKNLKLSSKWNGLFRHHGFVLYYTVKQAQEMDYGWNAINLKRVAHSCVENVVINNFSNPLYITDSRNCTVDTVRISGYDGHQGIKLYGHACDNLIKDVIFEAEYADMMGGEGNAYGNVFSNINYLNPEFKPCDYDFHGFSEGPMSPPAYNLFENIYGFRYIKMGGAVYNQPACAQWNIWWNCIAEGEKHDDYILCSLHYPQRVSFKQKFLILIKLIVSKRNDARLKEDYQNHLNELARFCLPKDRVSELFKNIWIYGQTSTFVDQNNNNVHMIASNKHCSPHSLNNSL